jgi:hypothetical protein
MLRAIPLWEIFLSLSLSLSLSPPPTQKPPKRVGRHLKSMPSLPPLPSRNGRGRDSREMAHKTGKVCPSSRSSKNSHDPYPSSTHFCSSFSPADLGEEGTGGQHRQTMHGTRVPPAADSCRRIDSLILIRLVGQTASLPLRAFCANDDRPTGGRGEGETH